VLSTKTTSVGYRKLSMEIFILKKTRCSLILKILYDSISKLCLSPFSKSYQKTHSTAKQVVLAQVYFIETTLTDKLKSKKPTTFLLL
jgi:hypothetical protein